MQTVLTLWHYSYHLDWHGKSSGMWSIWTGISLSDCINSDHLTASLVTCHRSSFRKLFFLLLKTKLLKSRLFSPAIGYSQQLQRSDWPDWGHVCRRQNQITAPSLNSFMCNWYRPRRKNGWSFSVLGALRWKLRSRQLFRWVCETAAEQSDDSACFLVRLQLCKLAAKDLSRCPLSVMLLIYTVCQFKCVIWCHVFVPLS